MKVPPLKDLPDLPPEIVQAGPNGHLVLFVGAGVSMLLDLPSWASFARKVLEDLQKAELLDFSELDQLESLPPRTQLSIAIRIAKENGNDLDLRKYFTGPAEGQSIYRTINDIGCTCVTTNYDELLSPRFLDTTTEPSATSREPIRVYARGDLVVRRLDEPGVVVHLHGAISDPNSMVVTTKDYLDHYDQEIVQTFLHDLFKRKIVLFLGYGLSENEILEHILRRGSVEDQDTGDRRRFVLQGFFRSQEPLYQKLYEYYRVSFGLHLIGFIRDYKDYKQQEAIIKSWAREIRVNKPALADDYARMRGILDAS